MAQHYDVTNQLPEPILKSIKRLVEYALKPWNRSITTEPWQRIHWYRKECTMLPKEYADFSKSEHAMNVGVYKVNLPELWKGDVKFEVHFNSTGITKIYLPL